MRKFFQRVLGLETGSNDSIKLKDVKAEAPMENLSEQKKRLIEDLILVPISLKRISDAVEQLGDLKAYEAVPELIKALKLMSEICRCDYSSEGICKHSDLHIDIGDVLIAWGEQSVPFLIKELQNDTNEAFVQGYLIWILGQIGPNAKDALPAITQFLETVQTQDIHIEARDAIEQIACETA